jgi:hypothetical protein
MIASEGKWYQWLTPDHPEIGLFEGGGYYPEDIYRPSFNSIMRGGTEFDVVGREAMIKGIYQQEDIRTFEDATPEGVYYENYEFFVDPMEPVYHSLDVQWYVDDVAVSGASGTTFNPASLDLALGEHTIRVDVVDNTDMVRDEEARAEYLTDSREWTFRRFVTTADDEDGTNLFDLSLREAIAIAGNETAHPGLDTIYFAPWLDEITLDDEIVIDSDVSIFGLGVENLAIDGQGNGRVFNVASGSTVTVNDLTITGGDSGIGNGGGILTAGDLTLGNVAVEGNMASNGGGIYSVGSLALNNVVVRGNTASYGGAIYQSGGSLTVTQSTIANNTNITLGGGLFTSTASVLIEDSTIDNNSAVAAGGIYSFDSDVSILNSTISTNTAVGGFGGLYFNGTSGGNSATLINATVANNNAGTGQGGGIYSQSAAYPIVLYGTIVAENYNSSGASDVYGTFDDDSSYNLIGAITGSTNLADGTTLSGTSGSPLDPELVVLGDYGGPTRTHALLSTSPAIDHGSTTVAAIAGILQDQRGYMRYFDDPVHVGTDGSIDIGAMEYSVARVENVTIGSVVSNGTVPAFSFDTVDGSEEQLRTIPVGAPDQISVRFTKEVAIPLSTQSDVSEILIALNRVVELPGVLGFIGPMEANDFIATWTLDAPLEAAQYLLRLSDSIVDNQGDALDGEWTNPASILSSVSSSTFPSGNRVKGGDFEFVFTVLPGDLNRDNVVNGLDIDPFVDVLVDPGSYDPGIVSLADLNQDGASNGFDIELMAPWVVEGPQFANLLILSDFDNDFDVDDLGTGNDEDEFWALFNAEDDDADLNGDTVFDQDDIDAFYEQLGFGIELSVV